MPKGIKPSLLSPNNALKPSSRSSARLAPLPAWLPHRDVPSSLLRLPGVPSLIVNFLRFYYSRKNVPTYFARQKFLNPLGHPDVAAYQHLFDHDYPRPALWWLVSSNMMDAQVIIRNRAKRRVREAIVEALRIKGYDRMGRVVGAGNHGGLKTLTGTMEVHVHNIAAIHVSWTELVDYAGMSVEAIVKQCALKVWDVTPKQKTRRPDTPKTMKRKTNSQFKASS